MCKYRNCNKKIEVGAGQIKLYCDKKCRSNESKYVGRVKEAGQYKRLFDLTEEEFFKINLLRNDN